MPDQSLDRGGGGRRQSSLLGQNLVKQLVEKDKGMESEEEDKEQKEEEGEVNEDGEEDEEIGWKKKRRKRGGGVRCVIVSMVGSWRAFERTSSG